MVTRWIIVFVLLFACVVNAAEITKHSDLTKGEKNMANNNLVLMTHFERQKDSLILTYEVENRSDKDVYLLNRLYRTIPKWTMNADIIYIEFEHDKSVVRLSKKIPDIPMDRYVTSPVSPFMTPLRVGKRFTERVNIPIPVRQYKEYNITPSGKNLRDQIYKQVYFVLGFYWAMDGIKEENQKIEGESVIMTKVPQGKKLEFGELVSPMESMDLPVSE